ncbi:MAG: hypothetical protein AMXMBFR6_13180 [Betaproteobacteria bacterium]
MRHDPIRRRIATLAARLMAEEGVEDFGFAKRKAARQLGVPSGMGLPTNQEVETELRTYHALFQLDEQADRLHDMRVAAAELMEVLAPLSPYLTGGVLDGTVSRFGRIELTVFSDNSKIVEIFLLNRGIDFESRDPPRNQHNGTETSLLFDWQDFPVRISIRHPHFERSQARTGPCERMRLEQLHALLRAEPAN